MSLSLLRELGRRATNTARFLDNSYFMPEDSPRIRSGGQHGCRRPPENGTRCRQLDGPSPGRRTWSGCGPGRGGRTVRSMRLSGWVASGYTNDMWSDPEQVRRKRLVRKPYITDLARRGPMLVGADRITFTPAAASILLSSPSACRRLVESHPPTITYEGRMHAKRTASQC